MLSAFTAGLLLITISELGDKTFFIAVILSMRRSRWLVFAGVVAALAAMTILSVVMGQAVSFLPKQYISFAEIALFFGFGLKLLYDAYHMTDTPCQDECQAAAEVVKQSEEKTLHRSPWETVAEAFMLTFIAEWGDRTQIATIALAASNPALGVTLGAILGHTICAAIAIVGGKLIAGRISERTITATGGALFMVFALVACFDLG